MNLLASFENLCKLCIKCFHFKRLGKRNKSMGRIMGLSGKEIENGLLAFLYYYLVFLPLIRLALVVLLLDMAGPPSANQWRVVIA